MEPELRILEVTVNEIKEQLAEVHGAIIGNPLSKDGGMSQRLIDAEEKLEELENRIFDAETKQVKYNIYTKIMWACAGGCIMSFFAYMLQLIFKH